MGGKQGISRGDPKKGNDRERVLREREGRKRYKTS